MQRKKEREGWRNRRKPEVWKASTVQKPVENATAWIDMQAAQNKVLSSESDPLAEAWNPPSSLNDKNQQRFFPLLILFVFRPHPSVLSPIQGSLLAWLGINEGWLCARLMPFFPLYSPS